MGGWDINIPFIPLFIIQNSKLRIKIKELEDAREQEQEVVTSLRIFRNPNKQTIPDKNTPSLLVVVDENWARTQSAGSEAKMEKEFPFSFSPFAFRARPTNFARAYDFPLLFWSPFLLLSRRELFSQNHFLAYYSTSWRRQFEQKTVYLLNRSISISAWSCQSEKIYYIYFFNCVL